MAETHDFERRLTAEALHSLNQIAVLSFISRGVFRVPPRQRWVIEWAGVDGYRN